VSGWWVQVSADRSRKEAESSGGRVKRRFTRLLKKRTYRITEVSLRDVGTYYRSRFGPYASRAAAAAACRTMKKRKQDCLVTR
jgi:hypothetical protein